jgi:hypothetical protein
VSRGWILRRHRAASDGWKRLRIYFRFERRLLGELCRAAARTVITVYRSASGRPDAVPGVIGATAREAGKGWTALIKQVYESDPLSCPKCGSQMKIIAFIERRQTAVIEKILRHGGLWEEGAARGPPAAHAKAVG